MDTSGAFDTLTVATGRALAIAAGRNAAERQRIKRKAARWAQGYRTMPAGERLAVLSAIMAVEAE